MKAALAIKELRRHRRLMISFVLNLSLGLMGFLALDAFRHSVTESLASRSKSILGADMVLSSRRSLSEEEMKLAIQTLPPGSQWREERSLFSMAWSSQGSRLVEIRAVDDAFPYYGSISLREGGAISGDSPKPIVREREVWCYPEVAIQLDLNMGDALQLGELSFTVSDVIEEDPSVSNMGFSPAPKVMMGMPHLEATGLLHHGSRQQHSLRVKLPPNVTSESISKSWRQTLPASDLTIRTHLESSQQLSRLLGSFSDYLGLVALVALFLSAVGSAYLFRCFVDARQKEVATLRALGMKFNTIVWITIAQLFVLGTAACLISLAGAGLLLPAAPALVGQLMPDGVVLSLGWRSLALAFLIGWGGALLFTLPSLVGMASAQPSALFRENVGDGAPKGGWWTWLPTIIVFWALSVWQAQSLRVGTLFVVVFLSALLLLWLLGRVAFALLLSLPTRPWLLRQGLLNLCRRRSAGLTAFCAIGLGTFLTVLIPQLSNLLRSELVQRDSQDRPSLFLFDIQSEQVEELRSFLEERGSPPQNLSPIINGRLLSIKGKPVQLEQEGFGREAERAREFRNRRLNLSERSGMIDSEEMVMGRPFSGTWEGGDRVEASLEIRYAERLGLGLGDPFRIDVLGLEMEAEVVNLRRVRWASFQPNFFVVLQPGLLEDAPKSWLGSVAGLETRQRAELQSAIVKRWTNVGIVDVTQTLERITAVVDQMAFALTVTSILAVLAGFGVLLAIARQQATQRWRDLHLLRLLGTSRSQGWGILVVEYLFLGALSALCGVTLALMATMVFGRFVFDGLLLLDLSSALFQGLMITALVVTVGALASRRAFQSSPTLGLRES